MYPVTYIERELRHIKNKRNVYYFSNILGLGLLAIIFIVIAPYLHEFLHIYFLRINNAHFYTDIKFDPYDGVYGKITAVSDLNIIDSITLMLIGAVGNIIIGLSILILGFIAMKEGMLPESNFFTYISYGFLLDPITYLFQSRGDFVNTLSMLDLCEFSVLLPILGIIAIFLLLFHLNFHLEHNIKYINDIERELRRIEKYKFRKIVGIQHD